MVCIPMESPWLSAHEILSGCVQWTNRPRSWFSSVEIWRKSCLWLVDAFPRHLFLSRLLAQCVCQPFWGHCCWGNHTPLAVNVCSSSCIGALQTWSPFRCWRHRAFPSLGWGMGFSCEWYCFFLRIFLSAPFPLPGLSHACVLQALFLSLEMLVWRRVCPSLWLICLGTWVVLPSEVLFKDWTINWPWWHYRLFFCVCFFLIDLDNK